MTACCRRRLSVRYVFGAETVVVVVVEYCESGAVFDDVVVVDVLAVVDVAPDRRPRLY